jgi:plastocyanin
VTIQNMSFSPASLTVVMGTTVTWTNKDNITHTVTADDASFDSGSIAPGSSYSRTFSTKGSFPYHCKIHPMMMAIVIVK